MRPPALDALGLNDTLHDFCAQFAERTQLEISYQGVAMTDLGDAHEITLYRLLQEALANVATHAQATRAEVALERRNSFVRLTVTDDGCGLDPEILEDSRRRGLGVVGMRERLETLGGRFEIASSSEGTTITATLPAGK